MVGRVYQPWDQAPEIWPIRCKRLAIYLGLRAPFRSLGHRAQGRFPKWVHGARTRFARFRGSQAEFDRLRRRGALLSSAVRTARSGPSLTVLVSYFYVISTAAARVGRRGRGWPRRTTSSTDRRRTRRKSVSSGGSA